MAEPPVAEIAELKFSCGLGSAKLPLCEAYRNEQYGAFGNERLFLYWRIRADLSLRKHVHAQPGTVASPAPLTSSRRSGWTKWSALFGFPQSSFHLGGDLPKTVFH